MIFRRNPLSILIYVALLTLCGTKAAMAISLAEYRDRVHQATVALDSLTTLSEDAGASSRNETEASALENVRRILPPTERVEWEGGVVFVNNEWLHKEIENYERMTSASDEERADALARIAERLHALESRLTEANDAKNSSARDTEAEKGRLAAILRRPEYNTETSRGGALQRMAEQIIKWLRDLFPQMKPIRPGTATRLSNTARILIYVLTIAVILFVVWRYVPGLIRRRRMAKKTTIREARIVLGQTIAPDQSAADLLGEAEMLARQGDVRGAIRKAYIALLCELGDRKILRLAQHKTNRDYLRDVQKRMPLYEEMQPLTINFERHWYGFEAATESDWQDFYARCQKALNAT